MDMMDAFLELGRCSKKYKEYREELKRKELAKLDEENNKQFLSLIVSIKRMFILTCIVLILGILYKIYNFEGITFSPQVIILWAGAFLTVFLRRVINSKKLNRDIDKQLSKTLKVLIFLYLLISILLLIK